MPVKGAIFADVNLLASKQLNIFLAVAVSTYCLLLTGWSLASPNQAVINIGNSLPFKLVLALFVLNNYFCLLKHLPVSLSACAIDKPPDEKAIKKRHYLSSKPASSETLTRLKARLARSGYRIHEDQTPERFTAVRGRYSPLATIVFHAALFTLVIGIILGALFKSEGRAILVEGQSFFGQRRDYVQFTPKSGFNRLAPEFSFKVKKIKPTFWRNELLFTDLYGDISYPAKKPAATKRVRLNVAWKPTIATYVNLVNMGYAPLYELRARGRLLESGFVKLVTFPPGARDSFRTTLGDLLINVRIWPDHVLGDGRIGTKSPNLRNPAYAVSVAGPGGRKLFKGLMLPGQKVAVDGQTLAFPEIRYWGEFRVIRNPGLPIIWLGFWVGSLAVVWRLFFYQRQITFALREDGRLIMTWKFDYEPIANELFLKSVAGEIIGEELARRPL